MSKNYVFIVRCVYVAAYNYIYIYRPMYIEYIAQRVMQKAKEVYQCIRNWCL